MFQYTPFQNALGRHFKEIKHFNSRVILQCLKVFHFYNFLTTVKLAIYLHVVCTFFIISSVSLLPVSLFSRFYHMFVVNIQIPLPPYSLDIQSN